MVDRVVWQFSRCHALSSYLIRYGTRSDWSHVDAVLPDGRLLGSLMQGGVQIRPADYYPYPATLRVALKTPRADRIYELLHSQVGKPYDYQAIFAFAFGDRDWRETDAWFCSELQMWAIEQADFFPQRFAIPVDRLSPRDQLLLLSPWIELIA